MSATARAQISELTARMGKSIIGQQAVVQRLVIGLLANGNLLVERLLGLAKKRAFKALAQNLESDFSRIQFTPDLPPSDVTGKEVYHQADGKGEFRFDPGPIFAFGRAKAALSTRDINDTMCALALCSSHLRPAFGESEPRLRNALARPGASHYGPENSTPQKNLWSEVRAALDAARREHIAATNRGSPDYALPPLNPGHNS